MSRGPVNTAKKNAMPATPPRSDTAYAWEKEKTTIINVPCQTQPCSAGSNSWEQNVVLTITTLSQVKSTKGQKPLINLQGWVGLKKKSFVGRKKCERLTRNAFKRFVQQRPLFSM